MAISTPQEFLQQEDHPVGSRACYTAALVSREGWAISIATVVCNYEAILLTASTSSPYAKMWHPGSRVKASLRKLRRCAALTRLPGCQVTAGYGEKVELCLGRARAHPPGGVRGAAGPCGRLVGWLGDATVLGFLLGDCRAGAVASELQSAPCFSVTPPSTRRTSDLPARASHSQALPELSHVPTRTPHTPASPSRWVVTPPVFPWAHHAFACVEKPRHPPLAVDTKIDAIQAFA